MVKVPIPKSLNDEHAHSIILLQFSISTIFDRASDSWQKALQSFFGIGPNVSARLLAKHHLHDTCRVGELANTQILEINATLTEMKIENDLRRQVLGNIARLRDTGTYRGKRHAMGLPVRGQRTKNQVRRRPYP